MYTFLLALTCVICICESHPHRTSRDTWRHKEMRHPVWGGFTLEDLDNTIAALDGVLHFFDENADQVNFDAVLGTRMVEGQMRVLYKQLVEIEGITSGSSIQELVYDLYSKALKVSNKGESFIKKTQPHYYNKLWRIIQPGFWELDYRSRDINLVNLGTVNGSDRVREVQSDYCISEMIGRPINNDQDRTPACGITDTCWNMMTSPLYRGYSLTHEVFYLEIGEQTGCMKEMAHKVQENDQPSVDDLNSWFCSNIYKDALQISSNGFMNEQKDLFMEQLGLCGMLGFKSFFHPDWLHHILSWQRNNGCYGKYKNFIHDFHKFGWNVLHDKSLMNDTDTRETVKHVITTRMDELAELYKRQLTRVKRGATQTRRGSSRVKREEKRMTQDCLAHKTTVAGIALAMHIRYILEDIHF